MNGKDLKLIRNMDDGAWRGYLAAKVEGLAEQLLIYGKNQTKIFSGLKDLELKVVQLPPHCLHEEDFQKMCRIKDELDKRVDGLELEQAGRKAVARALWGSGGGLTVLGVVYLVLKLLSVGGL